MIAYCDAKKIPVKASIAKPYSSDENCLHISYEAGQLEDPAVDGIAIVDFGMTVSPQDAPDKVEEVTIGFEHGVPVSLNGQQQVGPGDGRGDEQDRRPQRRRPDRHRREPLRRHEEPRRVRSARHDGPLRGPPWRWNNSRSTATRSTSATGSRPEVAEMVYYGFWFVPKMDALMAFSREFRNRSPAK